MRRSHRCILKHEIRLASKAEHEAAEAGAAAAPPMAEVSQELTLAVPSTVTKAIAGLATPCLPSPSTFPEDWRMFSELLHDSQSQEGQSQSLCPTQLFSSSQEQRPGSAELPWLSPAPGSESDMAGPVLGNGCDDALAPSQPILQQAEGPLMRSDHQDTLSLTDLLTGPELAPDGKPTAPAPALASTSHLDNPSPVQHPALFDNTNSLDDCSFDGEYLDDMWDELGDLGWDAGDPDLANLSTADISRSVAAAMSPRYLPSTCLQPQRMVLPPGSHQPGTSSIFIPAHTSSHSGMSTLLQLPHSTSIASQQSSDSSSTVIASQMHFLPGMSNHTPPLSFAPGGVGYPIPVGGGFPIPTGGANQMIAGEMVVPIAGPSRTAVEEVPCNQGSGTGKKKGKGAAAKKADKTVDAPKAAPAVRKKRGPYKKRVKPEGEQAAPKRRKGAMSLMPALEQFASRVKQEREAGGGGQGWVGPMPQQGPSKKPRLAVPEAVLFSSHSLTGLASAAPAIAQTATAETHQAVVAQQQAGRLPSTHGAQFSQQQARLVPSTHGVQSSQQQAGQLCSMHGAPLSQQQHDCQVSSSQAPASCRACQAAQGSGSDAVARLSSAAHCTASVQAQPASTAVLQPGHKQAQSTHSSQQQGPALQQTLSEQQTGQVSGIPIPISGAKQPLNVNPGSQAQASIGQSLPSLCHLAVQHQETPLPTSSSAKSGWQVTLQPGCVQPASAAMATDTAATSGAQWADAKPSGVTAASGVETATHAGAIRPQVAVQPAAVLFKAQQASPSSALEQSSAIPGSQVPPDAKCQVKVSSPNVAAMRSFVPQALHHLATKCTSLQAGEKLQAGRGAQADRSALPVKSAKAGNSAQTDGPAQSDTSAQPDRSAQAGRAAQAETAAQAERAAQADKAAQVRANPYGIRSSSRAAASSKPATSSSADVQKPPTRPHWPSADLAQEQCSSASTAQQASMLSQQRRQLNAILNSLQLPGVDSLELSSSEDLSFGDIPSEDDCDSADSSSATAADSSGSASSKDDSSREDSGGDNDAEYRPGGQRASRKKPGKAKECKTNDVKRVSGRRKGNRHITMKFLEEGGYFDAPIQDAAKQLNVGVTTLKKICRIAKVTRWPFRKRTSIERLIERTKYFMEEDDEQPGKGQKIAALQTLQEEKADLKAFQQKDLGENIKAYRQAMFKLNHTQRRSRKMTTKHRKADQAPAALRLPSAALQRILPDLHATQQ